METGKTGKYFKYAIGEIILVVIGILIALQINNWNENRKLQKEELKLLQDIKANIKATLKDFEFDTLTNTQQIQQYQKIEQSIQKDLPYTTDLDSAFGVLTLWNGPYIITTAYKTLQSKGLDLIKNESLKNEINKMYEIDFQVLLSDYDRSEWNLSENVVMPFFSKHIRRLNDISLNLARPNNFENLKQNDEFLNILAMLIRQRKRGLLFYKENFQNATKLIEQIDKEINLRTK
jgi:hypothetical protein